METHYQSHVAKLLNPWRARIQRLYMERPRLSRDDAMRRIYDVIGGDTAEAVLALTALTFESAKSLLEESTSGCTQGEFLTAVQKDPALSDRWAEVFSLDGTLPPPEASTQWAMTTHIAQYEKHGQRAYLITPGLSEKLEHTELRGVCCDELRLPYPAIYIGVPENTTLQVWNEETQWHRLRGVYVYEDPYVFPYDSDGSDATEMPVRGWRVMCVGEDKSAEQWGNDALEHWCVRLVDGQLIDEELAILEQSMARRRWRDGFVPPPNWVEVFRWVMNLVMYVTWAEPGREVWTDRQAGQLWSRVQKLPRNSPKRKKLQGQLSKMNTSKQFVVGESIKVSRNAPVCPREGVSGNGPAQRVAVRVAGHWRRVAHGEGRALRRWQFIEPFWRNRDGIFGDDRPREVR